MRRTAFTLIELLVVITVIVILAGLLIVGGGLALKQARITGTVQRIEGVTRALSQIGQVEGSATLAVQRRLGEVDPTRAGVLLVDYPDNQLTAVEGGWLSYGMRFDTAADAWVVADASRPHHLRVPWGQAPLVYPTAGAADRSKPPAPFALSQMDPAMTAHLLDLAELLPGGDLTRYTTDRDPDEAWNDRWGHPLVVGYALYQYGPQPAATNETPPPSKGFNWQWKLAKETYGYTRSCYFAVGSAGPLLDVPVTDVAALWGQINQVANQDRDGTELYRVGADGTNAMARPPWEGVRVEKAERRIAVLSSPLEVR